MKLTITRDELYKTKGSKRTADRFDFKKLNKSQQTSITHLIASYFED